MEQLFDSLLNLIIALWEVVFHTIAIVLPWTPLLAWVAFWLIAVNWVKYREVLLKGGWTGLALIWLMMILIWGLIAPPDGFHHVFGLKLSNFVGKMVYVSALFCIMFICGSVQLAGSCNRWINFGDDEESSDSENAPAH